MDNGKKHGVNLERDFPSLYSTTELRGYLGHLSDDQRRKKKERDKERERGKDRDVESVIKLLFTSKLRALKTHLHVGRSLEKERASMLLR